MRPYGALHVLYVRNTWKKFTFTLHESNTVQAMLFKLISQLRQSRRKETIGVD